MADVPRRPGVKVSSVSGSGAPTPSVSTDAVDVAWMKRAVLLAWRSNPVKSAYCVGCVIVSADKKQALAAGYSRELPGNTHAEQCALHKLSSGSGDAKCVRKGLHLYSTMEPCSKRTSGNAPCCESILASGAVSHVYVGAAEPENFVNCKGTMFLIEKGIKVIIVRQTGTGPSLAGLCLAPNAHILSEVGPTPYRIRQWHPTDANRLSGLRWRPPSGPIRLRLVAERVLASDAKIKAVDACRDPLLGVVDVASGASAVFTVTYLGAQNGQSAPSALVKALLTRAKVACREQGCSRMSFAVAGSNQMYVSAAKACGFVEYDGEAAASRGDGDKIVHLVVEFTKCSKKEKS